ncbi:YbaK/EbsC family protein [Romboutsia sp.]|uniref:YbaK/EbsC family protein n=1 Tax=Romboutsia sp. TaxID=1965302 RepID=UPI002CDB3C98|nr:YbaK/EbsC family protein [Romboutsia sp.]HSQ90469.1 YbaK/EbsC family protein [Romboutsia sp.]
MEKIFEILEDLAVNFKKYEHEPVKTCAESTALLPDDIPGVRTKHLFLRDKKKKNYFVVVVDENKLVDLKSLSNQLDVKSIGMASEEELKEYFKIEVGSLSMLAFLNVKDSNVRLLIDEEIWDKEAFDCHPNVNNIVLSINKEDWLKIFNYMKRTPEVIFIPEKQL